LSRAHLTFSPANKAGGIALLHDKSSNSNSVKPSSDHKRAREFELLFRTHRSGRSRMFGFSGWRKSLGSSWGVL